MTTPAPDPELVTLLAEHQEQANDAGVIECQCDGRRFDSPADMARHQAAVVEGRVQERIAAELEAAAQEIEAVHAAVEYDGRPGQMPRFVDAANSVRRHGRKPWRTDV